MEGTDFLFPKSQPWDWTRGSPGGDAAGCMASDSLCSRDTTEQPFLFIWPHVVQKHLGGARFCPPVMPSTGAVTWPHQSPSLRVIQGPSTSRGGTYRNHSSELPLEQTVAKKERSARAGKKQTPWTNRTKSTLETVLGVCIKQG